MASISLNKLKLSINKDIEKLTWGEQEIEVKQYLPIEEKLLLVSDILSYAADEQVFYNPCILDIFKTIYMIDRYTNLHLSDKDLENISKTYDKLVSSGLAQQIFALIPTEEKMLVEDSLLKTINNIYAYKNSVAGMVEQLNNSYVDLEDRVTNLQNELSDPESLGKVNDIITKLG